MSFTKIAAHNVLSKVAAPQPQQAGQPTPTAVPDPSTIQGATGKPLNAIQKAMREHSFRVRLANNIAQGIPSYSNIIHAPQRPAAAAKVPAWYNQAVTGASGAVLGHLINPDAIRSAQGRRGFLPSIKANLSRLVPNSIKRMFR